MSTIFHRRAAPFWWGKELPKHIIYLYKEFDHDPWKEYTIYDLIKEKVEKQERHIWMKRKSDRNVNCYIYLHKFSEEGRWYISIHTLKSRIYVYDKMNLKIRQRHNCGVFPEFYDEWANTFYLKYKKEPNKYHVKRAVKFTRCILDSYNNLIDIL